MMPKKLKTSTGEKLSAGKKKLDKSSLKNTWTKLFGQLFFQF